MANRRLQERSAPRAASPRWRRLLAVIAVSCAASTGAAAQVTADTTRRPALDTAGTVAQRRDAPQAVQEPDSLRPPLSPGRAFLNSFFLPGLGQSRLRRHSSGALYFTLEAVAVAMLAKSKYDLRVAREREADGIASGYRLDPVTGEPARDAGGNFIPLDTVRSRYDSDRVKARRTHVEDWIAVLIFNHLFSGADAFVSSLLWDLPARVGFRPAPNGVGAGVFIRW